MTVREFRRLALAMPEATEASHMGHPDFRVRGKIFATLGYPDENFGMIKLTPEQQQVFIGMEPEAFEPAAGKWGLGGATVVRLRRAKAKSVRAAMAAAWSNAAPRGLRDPLAGD